MRAIDYTSDAPCYTAWAGDGPCAANIYESGDKEALLHFQDLYNISVGRLVHLCDMAPADAIAEQNPEEIARNIVITRWGLCRVCETDVKWTTAAWEDPLTEAPIDGAGNLVCVDHDVTS